MRVAIVHDYLTQRGGAERVVLSLARLFEGAPIYTSVYDPAGTYPELGQLDVRPSFLQHVPHSGNRFRALLPLYPAAFASLRLKGYDLVVSSSSGWAHGVDAGGARHLWYCYTPARWLYGPSGYLAGTTVPPWAVPAVRPVLAALRRWDRRAARRPDQVVAISQAVAARVDSVYGRRAVVVHPPVDAARFADVPRPAISTEPYYLVVSRLLAYKRVALVVDACRRLGRRLVVVGDGPDRRRIEARAWPGLTLHRAVDDDELARLLGGCTAVVHAAEEDFGLVPLEANAAGRPAVALGRGGALETVVDGRTGLLFGEPVEDAVVDALLRAEAIQWDPEVLRDHARSFGEDRFHGRLRQVATALVS